MNIKIELLIIKALTLSFFCFFSHSLFAIVEYHITPDMVERNYIYHSEFDNAYRVSIILNNGFKEKFQAFTKKNTGEICKVFYNGIFYYQVRIDAEIRGGHIQLKSFSSLDEAETFITDILRLPLPKPPLIRLDEKKMVSFIELDDNVIVEAYIFYNPYLELFETFAKLNDSFAEEFSKYTESGIGITIEIRRNDEFLYDTIIPYQIETGIFGLKSFNSYDSAIHYLKDIPIAEPNFAFDSIIRPNNTIDFLIKADMIEFYTIRHNLVTNQYEVVFQLNNEWTSYLTELTKLNIRNSVRLHYHDKILYTYVINQPITSGMIQMRSFDSKNEAMDYFKGLHYREFNTSVTEANLVADKYYFNITNDMIESSELKKSLFDEYGVMITLTSNTLNQLSKFVSNIIGNELIISINYMEFYTSNISFDFSDYGYIVKTFDTQQEAESFINKLRNDNK